MVTLKFERLHPWALTPEKPSLDVRALREERDLYAEHFKHKRIARLEADCPPYRMGFELGWEVRSPVSIRMRPLDDADLGLQDGEDIGSVGRRYGRTEAWDRDDGWVTTSGGSWMQMYDYRTASGWEAMFLPNGQGTIEWHLGWTVDVPKGYFLATLPIGATGIDVPLGVISDRANQSMLQNGFSLAFAPTSDVVIRRGTPVARIVLLHADSLQASAA
ncbi:hypothetical protein [Curtobacterium sp. Leaf154]|uniref:hypothetical protein n=1 Tax=Curtobacterium sp. Leaf154 TaxID=1736277 RepID=UPI000A50E44E|nr:hypothetical protein [Curtobacterium sp. Leaf154]